MCSADCLPNEIDRQNELFFNLQPHLLMEPLSGKVGWKYLGEDFCFSVDLLFSGNIKMLLIE